MSLVYDASDPELPDPPPEFWRAPQTPAWYCWRCKGTDFWQSRTCPDVRRCRACVPPAPGAEVAT